MSPAPCIANARFVSRARAITFMDAVRVVSARQLDDVAPALARIEGHVGEGLHAAGYIAYEAAPAFDPALKTHPPGKLPLLWFALYRTKHVTQARHTATSMPQLPWEAPVAEDAYRDAFARIRDFIAAGDTYQVNYTFPLAAPFKGDAEAWFDGLCLAQAADYCAFIDTGRYRVLSASPELFFHLDGNAILTRPMKGTRPRGRWSDEDRAMAQTLAASEKERAENTMIVDLLRNDLGRIAETGSVVVTKPFEIERYPTVWQMTSTIKAHTHAGVPEILRALFPSGSVTGAPKVRAMEIIRDIEPLPRGVYCGAVGWWSPGRQATFNVAIRTVTVDTQTATAEYHVGGGITWGSTETGEYEECRDKAALLDACIPEFELLESLLFDGGYFLLEEHLDRLRDSADYFGFSADINAVREALLLRAMNLHSPHKVRLLVGPDAAITIEVQPAPPSHRVRLGWAPSPVDDRDRFLYHKTTHRTVYDRARASRSDCDDVLLWNRRGELTESTTANVVLDIDGRLLTPPVSSGLLAGTMRGHLLMRGAIREAVLTKSDVQRCRSIRLINSVRTWIDVDFVNRE